MKGKQKILRQPSSSPCLRPGDEVWIPDQEMSGVVQRKETPRSYVIRTPTGDLRRNRRDVLPPQPNIERILDESDIGNETSLPERAQTEHPSSGGSETSSEAVVHQNPLIDMEFG